MTAQQLKASILQLAIQGKLVPQNPADEPASVLLKKIKAEKDALVKAGKIKKDKHESVIVRNEDGRYLEKKDGKTTDITDEIPFDIPESWEWARLKSFADSCLGKMLDAQKNKGSLMPYLRNVNVRWHSFDLSDLLQMRFEQDELERYEVIPGDLIICEGGEPGRCAVWTDKREKMRIQKALHRIRPFLGISSFYLAYVIQLYSNNQYLSSFFTGTTIKHLTGKALDNLLFPLPPLEEQKRIVAKIEELLPHVEEYGKAETALSKLNAELPEQLKKSILQWAIQGRLVPQDPTDEPASELLKRIKAEKAALIKSGKLKKEKPLPPISEDEIPFDIPDSWQWVRLGSLGAFGGGKTPSMNRKEFWGGDVLWVTSKDMKTKYIYDTGLKVTKRGAEELQLLPPGTILMVTRSGILKHTFPVAINQKECTINQDLKSLSLFLPSMIEYVYILLKGSEGRILSHYKKKGTTVESIKWDSFTNMPLPIPPLAEQKRIVEKLETLLSALDNQT